MEEKEPDAQRWREVGEQRQGWGAGQRKQRRRETWGGCRKRWRHTDLRNPETKGKEFAWRQNWDYRHTEGVEEAETWA